MQAIDLYCERTGPGLWSEPVNALTNAAFFLAAWLIWRLDRGSGSPHPAVNMLIVLLVAIGTGSTAFHVFANGETVLLDIVPIGLFILGYIWCYLRQVLAVAATPAIGILILTLGAALAIRPYAELLNGSLFYAPALAAVSGLGLIHLLQNRRARYELPAAAGVFALALTFRTIDNQVCAAFPLGTHFLWHCLNALAAYLALRALVANLPHQSRCPGKVGL